MVEVLGRKYGACRIGRFGYYRLTDNKGRVVNFKNTIIIMTSNIGSHIIQENFEGLERKNVDEVVEKTQRVVMDLLRKTVRPEFQEAISALASVASEEDLAARPGARTAHSQGYARDEQRSMGVRDPCAARGSMWSWLPHRVDELIMFRPLSQGDPAERDKSPRRRGRLCGRS